MGYFFLFMGAGAASSAAAKAWLPRDCAAMTAGTAPEIARKFRREIELALVFMMLLLDLNLNLIDKVRWDKKQIGLLVAGRAALRGIAGWIGRGIGRTPIATATWATATKADFAARGLFYVG